VRCQSEALGHHASTLAAVRRAVNRKSELKELRAELAALRALAAARPRREPKRKSARGGADRVNGFGDEAEMRGR